MLIEALIRRPSVWKGFAFLQDGAVYAERLLCDYRKHVVSDFLKIGGGMQLISIWLAAQSQLSPNR